MRRERPRQTAFKVASVLVTAGVMEDAKLLPPGLVEANERVLLEAGRLSRRGLRFFRSSLVVWLTRWIDAHGRPAGHGAAESALRPRSARRH